MPRNYELPAEFLDAAERFVGLANEVGESRAPDWVRTVLMYAAARYNAYSWLTGDHAATQSADEAANYFASEYRTMFRENISELEPVYRGRGTMQA